MAPVPGLGGGGLTEPQRKALRQKIAEKKAAQVASEREAQAAKDRAEHGPKKRPTKGRELVGTPDPAQARGGAKKDWRNRNRTGGVVQGSDTRRPGAPPPKQKPLSEVMAEKAKARRKEIRPSRAATPQAEKPKNSNYKPKPKKDQGPPEKRAPRKLATAPKVTPPTSRQLQLEHKDNKARAKAGKVHAGTPNPDKGKVRADDKSQTLSPERRAQVPHKAGPANPGKSAKSSPGPGPTGTGGGRDADGGKGRTQFEDDRRKTHTGGADRPPIYRPQDDGQRGGYIGRSKKIIPAPGGGIPARKKKTNTGGTSVVKGLTPRF